MQRRFRLSRSTDFKRVRRSGKSYAHPLMVLVLAPSEHPGPRVGLIIHRSIGSAVRRNRAKRLLRAAIQSFLTEISSGHDLVLIGRSSLQEASFAEVQSALSMLLQRASLLPKKNELPAG